jgi:hypothetical protein
MLNLTVDSALPYVLFLLPGFIAYRIYSLKKLSGNWIATQLA